MADKRAQLIKDEVISVYIFLENGILKCFSKEPINSCISVK